MMPSRSISVGDYLIGPQTRLTAKVPGRYPDPGLAAPAVMVK